MENTQQHITDYSTAYDHSSDDFNFMLRVNRIRKMFHSNEILIALELALITLFGGLAYLLITI